MKPSILEGDRVWVNKLAYDLKVPFTTLHIAEWGEPRRGDIVVFYSPYDGTRLVKRVIGLPGDLIELRQNRLLLNGEALTYAALQEEKLRDLSAEDRKRQVYAREDLPSRSHPVAAIPSVPARRDFGPFRVPEGQYFMMGDNRDDSFDCRYFGPVERKRILGRVPGIALSFDSSNYWRPRLRRWFSSLSS
jgi:signal peptidase I